MGKHAQELNLKTINGNSLVGTGDIVISGGGGASDHGALTGLADDDHSQYHTDTRGDARYYQKSEIDTALNTKANSSHSHTISDVTGLQTAIDGKEPTISTLPVSKGGTGLSTMTGDRYLTTTSNGTLVQTVKSVPAGVTVGTTDTQTLTNKTISGASNTFSNIAQSSVTNLTTDLLSRPVAPLSGTYSARPAANSVYTGQMYYASDTLESYRATGTTGQLATAWTVIPAGGTELAYAQNTSNTTIATAAGGTIDVTGLVISVVVPERPFEVSFQGLVQYISTTSSAVVYIQDASTSTTIASGEAHMGRQGTSEFQHLNFSARVSDQTPGTTKQYKIAVLRRSDAVITIPGSTTFPSRIQAKAL